MSVPRGVAMGLASGVFLTATAVPFALRLHQYGFSWPGVAVFFLTVPLTAAVLLRLAMPGKGPEDAD